MPELNEANLSTEEAAGTEVITEGCPNCKGTGRRFRASAANPNSGDDIGACSTCNGTGRVAAEGVTHVPPANVIKESAEGKAEPVTVTPTNAVPTPTESTEPQGSNQ